MRPADLGRQAWTALRSDPPGGALLALSVAFGVAMLALVLSLRGGSEAALRDLEGTYRFRQLTVMAQADDWGALSRGGGRLAVRMGRDGDEAVKLTPADLAALKAEAPAVQAAYLRELSFLPAPNRKIEDSWMTLAVSEDYLKVADLSIVAGRGLEPADIAQRRQVVVITERAAREGFPDGQAVGQVVGGSTVVGVFRPGAAELEFRMDGIGYRGLVPYGARKVSQFVRELHFVAAPGQQAQAREQLAAAAARRWGERVVVNALSDEFAASRDDWWRARATLGVLGAAGLMTAGLSVLGLVTSRVHARRRLLAIAGAVGASARVRLVQVLAEVALPASLGAGLGMALAWGLVALLRGPALAPNLPQVRLDWPTLLGTAVGALALTLLCALPPAAGAARTRLGEALRG